MGSFMGHVLPGTFFISFSLWWMVSIYRRYFESRLSKRKYFNSSSFRCNCLSNFPLEAVIKLTLISIGIVGETVTGFQDGKFVHLGNGQHITMFGFFALNGVVDVVNFYRPGVLPPQLDYISAAVGFGVEAFLFSWHLHGRTEIDVQLHTFLVYAILLTVSFTILETFNRENVLFGLGRTFAVFLQGTWFLQISFILYNPLGGGVWTTHDDMMIITMIFAWHIAAIILLQAGIGCLVYLTVAKRFPDIISSRHIRLGEEYENETQYDSCSSAGCQVKETLQSCIDEEETLLEGAYEEYLPLPTSETA
ncbi:transmembrane protein 45B [Eurytemora carolleeae]|uniref:transmembrane protein 45B n=1 Tax=Eurytemora carolleeae TaxID=1294199 RepID=UPI000C75DF58|nr:transmembrane protein 45B [Eurytemora carolleeae]|eukprot:XP_023331184.1 transmembrane protein 45B-like [Eurytemora affinis]